MHNVQFVGLVSDLLGPVKNLVSGLLELLL